MEARRLLILDDDDAVAHTLSVIAGGIGFEVRIHQIPSEFLNSVDSWKPTHIALDLVLPSMDGMEVLAILSRMECKAFIILTSGMGKKVLESAQLSAIESGLKVRGVLPKPFHPRLLRDLLSDAPGGERPNERLITKKNTLAAVEATIQHGLDNNQFILHYQPKIDLATGKAVGFEGLVRWEQSNGGLIYPDAFIHVAEQTGQIDRMTHHIISIGLQWLRSIDDWISLSLNISARSLWDPQLIQLLNDECANSGVNPNRIILELTETSTMRDPLESLNILTRLRIRGFRLSIDDFGTGYSSMVQLARLPFSELKIDKSFVMSMETSSEARKIVGSIISLGRSLGLTTVAEGVETKVISDMLKELDCHLGQGYLFARPMAGPDAIEWLERWNKQI